jgi:GTP-binding protein Era
MSRAVRSRKPKHVSGFVSVLGRPNAGKSTLVNALVGAKVAIISDKPQTTRTTLEGVWTGPHAQIVFLDTPGLHEPDSLINQRMMQAVQEALDARDLLVYVHDATRGFTPEDDAALESIRRAATPTLLALNKIDRLAGKSALLPLIDAFRNAFPFEEYWPLSARRGDGVDDLRAAIIQRLPAGPPYYPADHLTDQPERFLASEIIREKILAVTREEVPHSVAVFIDRWEETPRLARVAATILVERPGQKGILLGAGGTRLKRVGTDARLELEEMLGRRMYLELHVKVLPGWREKPAYLKELDWRAVYGGEATPPATAEGPGEDGPVTFEIDHHEE